MAIVQNVIYVVLFTVYCFFTVFWYGVILRDCGRMSCAFRAFSAVVENRYTAIILRRATLSALRIGVESTSSGRGNVWLLRQHVHGCLPLLSRVIFYPSSHPPGWPTSFCCAPLAGILKGKFYILFL